jgi:hypothetical protein
MGASVAQLLMAEGTQAAAKTVWDVLEGIPGGDRAPVIGISVLMAVLLVMFVAAIVGKTMCRMQQARLEDALKRELVDRGFSADDVAKIVQSAANTEQRGPFRVWRRWAC